MSALLVRFGQRSDFAFRNLYAPLGAGVAIGLVLCAVFLIFFHFQQVTRSVQGKILAAATYAIPGQVKQQSPSDMLQILKQSVPTKNGLETNTMRSVWILTRVPECNQPSGCAIEIRGLRSEPQQFWRAELASGKQSIATIPDDNIKQASVGLEIHTAFGSSAADVFGYITPQTTRPISLFYWSKNDLRSSEELFERTGGILFGSMIFLALFAAIIAALHKDLPFLLLAGWLIATLRLAAINGGWDLYWFGFELSRESNLLVARLTLGAFGCLSAGIFLALFKPTLSKFETLILSFLSIAFFSFSLCAFVLDHKLFLMAFRPFAIFALLITLTLALRQFVRGKAKGAHLFFSAWLVVSAGAAADILFASGYLTQRAPLINLQSAAIAAGFIMAIALANRMQSEREERLVAERSAVSALTKFRENYESVPVGLFTINQDGIIAGHNPKFREMFSFEPGKSLHWNDLFPPRPYLTLRRRENQSFECALVDEGRHRWFEVQLVDKGDILEGTISEVTERKLGEERLEFAAHFDQLTGLHNRHFLIKRLDELLSAAGSTPERSGALGLIDLERFHQVVTYFGHAAGDDVLRAVRDRLKTALPTDAILGRLSADTFVVLLPAYSLASASEAIAGSLEYIHGSPFSSQNKSFSVKARAGVISLDGKRSSKEALAACDAALEEAKRRGNGSLVTYSDNDPAWLAHQEETALMARFREKIPFAQMRMVYQPIVSLSNPSGTMGYEALLRLTDDDGKFLSPALFIPALEKNGMMSEIDRWVVREVFGHLERNPEHFAHLTYASINLSGASLNDERFLQEMLALAAEHPTVVKKVCFEITETVALSDLESTKRFVNKMKMLGSRIALDDFGAGYSSFGYLSELQADFVKIDGSLIKNLEIDTTNYAVVKAISDLGRALNTKVVAEWVENETVLRALMALNISSGQGWALSKPLEAADVIKYTNGGQFVQSPLIRDILQLPIKEAEKA